jgi:hypothetical protein
MGLTDGIPGGRYRGMTKREERDAVDLAVSLIRLRGTVTEAEAQWARLVTPKQFARLWPLALKAAEEDA